MSLKVYVAANFAAREILAHVNWPFEVTSRWIYDDSHLSESSGTLSALVDLEDINRANVILLLVDQFSDKQGRGKYFELGYAYKAGKEIWLVGKDDSCVFYNLTSGVNKFSSLNELFDKLKVQWIKES